MQIVAQITIIYFWVAYLCGMKLILLSICLVGLAFAGIAIKLLLKKDGKFEGTCASNSPFLNKAGEPCSFCGAEPGEKCGNEEEAVSA